MFAEYMLPILMVACLLLGIFTGYPVAFVLGGLSIIFALVGDIPLPYLGMMGSRIFGGVVENWLYIAIPLFVFMGLMLEKSGVASRLLLTLQRLFGQVRGGLAISVALLGVVMAASTGIVGASVVMLGMLALPVMFKQNYKEEMALGVVAASGTLGILIPPSIMLVLMGSIMQVSVGDLFKGALIPGLMLGALYVGYLLFMGWLKPEWMPLADPDDLDTDTTPLALALLRDLVGPVFLMVAVLGSIMSGIATPTEAAAIGALGAMFLAIIARKLSYITLRDVSYDTAKSTAMIVFIVIAATAYSLIFKRLGGDYLIMDIVSSIGLGPYGLLLSIMLMIFILGCYVVLPLLLPVVSLLDFGMTTQATLVWFGILMAINLQTSFLTPPFGYALFYLKGVTEGKVKITTIYKSIIPYVLLQVTGLILCIAFPAIILWLPGLL